MINSMTRRSRISEGDPVSDSFSLIVRGVLTGVGLGLGFWLVNKAMKRMEARK